MDTRTPVLVSAARTPIARFNGGLRDVSAIELGATAVAGALEAVGDMIPDHVYLGNVVQAGNGQNPARSAAVTAGLPMTVPATTLNDVCLASMTATGLAATLIRGGEIDSAVVGGFDSMSRALHGVQVRQAERVGDGGLIDLLVRDGLWCALADEGMGPISDRANERLGISRLDQDEFANESHQRAAQAMSNGRFKKEIVPCGRVAADEGVRPDTTPDRLAQLRSAFTDGGTITAGNASQMSDAGAAGVMMAAGKARELGLTPMVEVVARATVAGPDASLHLKPAAAAKRLLAAANLTVKDIGLWEINEAFAGVVLASARELGVGLDQVNVNGGAIALGHPLGASGFRTIQTLAIEMEQRQVEFGIATMCGGGGQGQAILLRLL
ncbi:acetyl-CoA C-acyltransferase [Specibacter sp. RAF43]